MIHSEGIQYISIKSVLDDVHSMVPDIDWDEGKMLEWIAKGYRKLNLPSKYVEKVAFLEVIEHTTALPADLKYINQIFYKENVVFPTEDELAEIRKITGISEDDPSYEHMFFAEEFLTRIQQSNLDSSYRPLRRYDGHFGFQNCTQDIPRSNCVHQYSYEGTFITTSFQRGCAMLSYLAYVKDCDGLDMIPDDEVLKEALLHHALYRFWLSRAMSHEQGSIRQYQFHQQMYSHMSRRAVARLNMPTIDGMENIKNLTQRLVPRSNLYDTAFSRISNRENNTL